MRRASEAIQSYLYRHVSDGNEFDREYALQLDALRINGFRKIDRNQYALCITIRMDNSRLSDFEFLLEDANEGAFFVKNE